MTHVGVREFRDHATKYLSDDAIIAVERHGSVIGFYVPLPRRDHAERSFALSRLKDAVARVASETGLAEDDLASILAGKPAD